MMTSALRQARHYQPGLLTAAILLIGTMDYLTGPDIGFSLFYMVPIAWSGWRLGSRISLGLALLASVVWLASELGWQGVNPVSLWNGLTRVGIYVAIALLTSRIRLDQYELMALNNRLKELLAEEQHLARIDALTGLANRRSFLDEVRRVIEGSRQTGERFALAYIDIDRFKTLNDRFGQLRGDALLRSIGEMIQARLHPGDVAARIGGDDFGVIFDRCADGAAGERAAHLHNGLSDILKEDRFHGLGISIGVVSFATPPLAPDVLIDHADAAMCCAKARGGNSIYSIAITPAEADGLSARKEFRAKL
jgi:diguanylate cyclase (GGDEF)-like protein